MPLYDYTCKFCNYSFEKLLKISDCDLPSTEECPECSRLEVQKDPCAPGICDPVHLGVKKSSSDFQKYVLGRIAANHPGNTIQRTRDIVREI